jgi:hypothetical protein
MGDRENLFLQTGASVQAEAELLQRLLGLEPIPNTGGAAPDEIGLRGPARTVDGKVGYEVQPNTYAEIDPEPDDVQVFDSYPVVIDIWLGKDEGTQAQEARLVFDELVEARLEVPMLISHNLDRLVAAYLPGKGVYEFPADTSVDAPHSDRWSPWVPA